MADLRISSTAARRIARIAARAKRPQQEVLDEALRAGLRYEEWFRASVAKGLADIDAGRTVSHRQVLKNLARRKAALSDSIARGLHQRRRYP